MNIFLWVNCLVLCTLVKAFDTADNYEAERGITQLTVHNRTYYPAFCAAYYVQLPEIIRAGPLISIASHESGEYQRPLPKVSNWGVWDRQLVFAPFEHMLPERLGKEAYDLCASVNIGYTRGDNFYLFDNQGSWYASTLIDALFSPIFDIFGSIGSSITAGLKEKLAFAYAQQHPYAGQHAALKKTTGLQGFEQELVKTRSIRVAEGFNKLLGTHCSKVPRVAICASGGGYRAMIATLGFLLGAEETGILDTITYCAALSGSTWCLASWFAAGHCLRDHRKFIAERIKTNLFEGISPRILTRVLWRKFIMDQPLSIIDIYGALLGNKLLNAPEQQTLSQFHDRCRDGLVPYPIFTAVLDSPPPYQWVEFTPHELSWHDGTVQWSVPMWAFGRSFHRGQTADKYPEQALGFCMGIWGSAFSANMREIYSVVRENINHAGLLKIFDTLLHDDTVTGDARIFPARIHNPLYGVFGTMYMNNPTLTLLDAGLACNIPIPPLLRTERAIDIIIILDSSKNLRTENELHKIERWAQEAGIRLPAINYAGIADRACTVFESSDIAVPTIIYIPLAHNNNFSTTFDPDNCVKYSYCATENFVYTPAQTRELSELARQIFRDAAPQIIRAYRRKCSIK